jgi:hypothetical protein
MVLGTNLVRKPNGMVECTKRKTPERAPGMTTEPHHPQPPSNLERLDPESQGCSAFEASSEGGPMAAVGSLQHVAWATNDLSLLGGDEKLIAEVVATARYFEDFPILFDGEELREVRLEIPHVNFGTLDLLRFNAKRNRALVGDAKFGAWSVTPARRNLQGINYAAAVFLNYPSVRRVTVAFYQAKKGTGSVHTFYSCSLPKMVSRVRRIVENAQRVLRNPQPEDFTPHPVNCGFCHRINCPARLKLASTLVTAWNGKPIALPTLDLLHLPTPQLGALKKLSNVFKTFAKAIDDEAKRRAVQEDDVVEGYELRQRWHSRTVVGSESILKATEVLNDFWDRTYSGANSLPLEELIKNSVELSLGKIEECAAKAAPPGEKLHSQELTFQALYQAGLVTGNQFSYLIATKE